jgi:hypothetical protein
MSKMSSEAGADEPATEVLNAAAILNREGHSPEAADRSVQPQHRLGADPGGEPDKRGATRGGAIAGGALLAGGAALGVAIFADSEPTVGEAAPAGGDGGEGAFLGQGLLDPVISAEAPLEPVVLDPAASTGSLDDAAPVVSPGALAGVSTGTDPAHPAETGGAGAASDSPDPSGHDAAPGGSGGAGGGDDTAFGSGSGRDTSGGDTSAGDTGGGDTGGGDESGLLGVGSDEGVLNTGLLASESESSGDESESSGDSGGEDDGGGGLLDTGLLA